MAAPALSKSGILASYSLSLYMHCTWGMADIGVIERRGNRQNPK
jgi:hypothetical protein